MERLPRYHQRTRIRRALSCGLAAPLLLALLLAGPLAARDACPDPGAPVYSLHDLRSQVVAEGDPVVVEAVTTAAFMEPEELGGFYLQQGAGTDAAGIFVYAPREAALAPARQVQVHGELNRHRGRLQISRLRGVHDCGPATLPQPLELRLPDDAARLEQYTDLLVRLPQTLTVTANRDLGRYGSLTLAAEGRLRHPGQTGDAAADAPSARTIELDDASYRANPDPVPYLDTFGTRRAGSTTTGLTGILTHAFGRYRIHPTAAVNWEGGERPNPPPAPADTQLRIATANMENDFVTLGERGAQTVAERERQTAKLDALLRQLDADLIGAVELENTAQARTSLVQRLNRAPGSRGEYAAPAHPDAGDDAIKVGLLYRPDRLRLLETRADANPIHDRPPLLGWFEDAADGLRFGAVVVHFKAKSGCPDRGDVDHGQGCWNARRSAQAQRLVEWIEAQRQGAFADTPVLILGDLNAYAAEDPLTHLREAGKRDLVHTDAAKAYTYVFRGQAGQLDYLLGPQHLRGRVQRGGSWAVNADEPVFLGYDGRLPADGPWRASDHDPVWADLQRPGGSD
ncbi:ExeM/NucH family extracellular endonuclease [Thioalkalivibrio sp. ALJ16]|uniref:ExeM/NucH family extracellular endonuclease n=1 Tax=Thioalkalivibrio sp. ALJ16 TaxID=1158762 RepID=UPI00036A9D7A|nr:ExeM/NucH family extracellular endonuclease [Thioalkalivibrio sp. ALJ16]